ncbi:MAG: PilN domain-containing protein [Candidatus Gottesmanbacteria bacterium]
MIEINLLPGVKQPLGKFLTWILTYGRYIIIGTEIIVLLAFLSRFKLDRELTDLHQSITQKQEVVIAAKDLENEVRKLQNHLLIIKKLQIQRSFPPKLLAAFEQLTPSEVTLKSMSINADMLQISATAVSNQAFTTFLNNLSASAYFSDISLDNVSKAENGGVEFTISTKTKKP